MPLCTFSSKLAMDGFTVIENTFFNEFLPQATGDDVKVYLYGLSLCSNPNSNDNSMDMICKVLSLTEEQVVRALFYWQEMGLVQVVSREPLEVRFLPVAAHSGSSKIRNPEKYADFNKSLESIISGRMITPHEFNEYYGLIESEHFEPEALLLIVGYCTKFKSPSIGYPYILAVARDFAREGLKTYESVEEKILEQEKSGEEIKQILLALGLKRDADLDERNLYIKWTNKFGFTQGVIVYIAKNIVKRGGFSKLDDALTKFYEQKLLTIEEISEFSEKQDEMFECAKSVCKIIGVYYQDYESVVSSFILDWTNKGYEKPTLEFIAKYCQLQELRSLNGMNVVIQKFYKLGLVSLASIQQYIDAILANDEKIREVLDKLGLLKVISSKDRELYKTWTNSWNFSHEQILLVAKFAFNCAGSMGYVGKVLSSLHEQGITDTEKIETYLKGALKSGTAGKETIKHDYMSRDLSKEQLSAVIDSLDEVEI